MHPQNSDMKQMSFKKADQIIFTERESDHFSHLYMNIDKLQENMDLMWVS